jgi:hypothetical protein
MVFIYEIIIKGGLDRVAGKIRKGRQMLFKLGRMAASDSPHR